LPQAGEFLSMTLTFAGFELQALALVGLLPRRQAE
jgi:LPXTG-motif cell wall-anchored protein